MYVVLLVDTSKVTQVPVHKTAASLSLADMDQVILKGVVEVVGDGGVTLKQATFDPADLAAALLVDKQPGAELLRLDLEETGQLLEIHSSIELQV